MKRLGTARNPVCPVCGGKVSGIRDGLVYRVVSFLQRNPEESLRVEDALAKFPIVASYKSASRMLALAVKAGVLRREKVGDRTFEYFLP